MSSIARSGNFIAMVCALACLVSACGNDGSAKPGSLGEAMAEAVATDKKAETDPKAGEAPAAPAEPSWDGTYQGVVMDTQATLQLVSKGATLTGSINAAGYPYRVQATVEGADSARGKLIDGNNGAELEMQMQRSDGSVAITLSGPTGQVRFDFVRAGAGGGAAAPAGGAGGAAPAGGGSAPARAETRDPTLVGRWGRNDTLISGEASMVTSWYLVIRPDGTYTTGTSKSSAGGDGWSAENGAGDALSGRWKTQGNVVYVQDGGSWAPYARYYVEGRSLMFTFGNGKRQVWHRR